MTIEKLHTLATQAVAAATKRREIKAWHNDLYWIESRPEQKGDALIKWSHGQQTLIIGGEYALGNAVHEYGGGDYTLDSAGNVYFVRKKDQQIYQWIAKDKHIKPLTHGDSSMRYADLDIKGDDLIAVKELHHDHKVTNVIVHIDLLTHKETVVAEGHDFYACPRFEPNGKNWAYLSWNHPKMPWDVCELWVGVWSETAMQCMNEAKDEVISQFFWHEGSLYYVSDRTGWANVYQDGKPLCAIPLHFGIERWQFGGQTIGMTQSGQVVAIAGPPHDRQLGLIRDGQWHALSLPCCDYSLDLVVQGDAVVVQGLFMDQPAKIIAVDVYSGEWQIVVDAANPNPKMSPIKPEHRTFKTMDGEEAHAFFYDAMEATSTVKPPLLVMCHGGPTAATSPSWDPMVQFWVQMGFSVVDVNYRGSTGYGRAYQDALKYRWGEQDLADCVAAVHDLIRADKINPAHCFIRGKSSGGLTALMGLVNYPEFKAGASYYGVTDLMQLMQITHKFEQFYLDDLIGPYPEAKADYQGRSPVNHLANFNKPVIFFHGLKDAVVPPMQTEAVVNRLKQRGLVVEYHAYPQEKHGFKAFETKKDALMKECQFYLLNVSK